MEEIEDWANQVATALEVELPLDLDLLLGLSREVAHGVARPAVPLTMYLLGAAVAGGTDIELARDRVNRCLVAWQPAS